MWSVRSDQMYRLLNDLQDYSNAESCYAFGEFHHLVLKEEGSGAAGILQYLQYLHHQHIVVQPAQPTIEDCFIDLMSRTGNMANHE